MDEERAIQEKFEQLKRIKEGSLSSSELRGMIMDRRLNWIKDNLDKMLEKYRGLSPEEQAYRIIYFEHMDIDKKDSKMTRVSEKKIRIDSYNFCPYLEACKLLNLDTRFICRFIGEPAVQRMIEVINPNLRFSRNYENIRPYSLFCEEYIEVL